MNKQLKKVFLLHFFNLVWCFCCYLFFCPFVSCCLDLMGNSREEEAPGEGRSIRKQGEQGEQGEKRREGGQQGPCSC